MSQKELKMQLSPYQTPLKDRDYTFSNRPTFRFDGNTNSNVKGIQLVTQMFISLQTRPQVDMYDFFTHL